MKQTQIEVGSGLNVSVISAIHCIALPHSLKVNATQTMLIEDKLL